MGATQLIDKIKRAYLCVEDKEYDIAIKLANEVLSLNPEYGHCYAILLLCDIKKTYEELLSSPVIVSNNKNYKRIMLYGDDELKEKYLKIDKLYQEHVLKNCELALSSADKEYINSIVEQAKTLSNKDLKEKTILRLKLHLEDADFLNLKIRVSNCGLRPDDDIFDDLLSEIRHFDTHIGLQDLNDEVIRKKEEFKNLCADWEKTNNKWEIKFGHELKTVAINYTTLQGFETSIKYWDIKTLEVALSYNHIDFYINKGMDNACWIFFYKNKEQFQLLKTIITSLEERLTFFKVEDINKDENYLDIVFNKGKKFLKKAELAGCYIATCVYGSYDCPNVWILRRYRDNYLSNSLLGRLFIKLYYKVSPTLVAWFGNKSWFKKPCLYLLNKKIKHLRAKGYKDTPYIDKY